MRYPPQLIDQLKNRLSIVEEVRKVVPGLKKKGRYWWGCCPFHHEKTPSFHVRDDQNSYYCFGCGAAGDVITFVQETQGGNFNEVVQRLAKQVGLKLPEPEQVDPKAAAARNDGLKALERAAVFFQCTLAQPKEGEPARAYIAKRALSQATVEEFMLGYSPDAWDGLKNALLGEGFSPQTLQTAGLTLASEKGRGDYDRFRGRLMFPIHDAQARVVGFGGRILDKGEPKYLNSPETPFFNKSFLLYNLHRATPHLKQGGPLVLVEGYMDVIALYQAGFRTAVAPLGTSVTEDQLALLWHKTPTPLVCLDGDSAGRNAALRVAHKALPVLEPGKSLQFVFLPQGEDPDSLVQKDGVAAFRSLLATPLPLENVLWQNLTAGADFTTADGRAALEGALGSLLATIRHATVRRHYGQILRDRLYQATRGNRSPNKPQSTAHLQAPKDYEPPVQGDQALRSLLATACRWPEIVPQVDEVLATLPFTGELAELSQFLLRAYVQLKLSGSDLKNELESGPYSNTLQSLIVTTGLAALPDDTDAQALFGQIHAAWLQKTSRRQTEVRELKGGEWFRSEESWNKFKKLKISSPTS